MPWFFISQIAVGAPAPSFATSVTPVPIWAPPLGLVLILAVTPLATSMPPWNFVVALSKVLTSASAEIVVLPTTSNDAATPLVWFPLSETSFRTSKAQIVK